MFDGLMPYYLWIKAFHIFAIIAWMAGLFYFPRLLAYHALHRHEIPAADMLKVMEERLYKIIMTPAMIFSLASGTILVMMSHVWMSGWMHLKIFAVIGLVIFQFLLFHWHQELSKGTCERSTRFFRIINEIPTLLLIIIVVSVVVKPF